VDVERSTLVTTRMPFGRLVRWNESSGRGRAEEGGAAASGKASAALVATNAATTPKQRTITSPDKTTPPALARTQGPGTKARKGLLSTAVAG
jgi:hypothetical protein